MPPPDPAEFPLRVQLLTVSVAWSLRMPLPMSSVIKDGGATVGNGQAGDGDGRARTDVEHAASGVAVDGQQTRPGADDVHAVGDEKLAAGQCDGAGSTGSVNRVPISG